MGRGGPVAADWPSERPGCEFTSPLCACEVRRTQRLISKAAIRGHDNTMQYAYPGGYHIDHAPAPCLADAPWPTAASLVACPVPASAPATAPLAETPAPTARRPPRSPRRRSQSAAAGAHGAATQTGTAATAKRGGPGPGVASAAPGAPLHCPGRFQDVQSRPAMALDSCLPAPQALAWPPDPPHILVPPHPQPAALSSRDCFSRIR